tara:strand:+ start:3660 stop:4412 length:753 start_codon:yes stop_codon:yes gene_type:complete
MKPIHIVTVSDGNISTLKLTLQSIENQSFKKFKNIIVSKKRFINLDKKFITKRRVFHIKKKSSIYEAMNYGINKSKNNYILFLNSGDTFTTKLSLKRIIEHQEKNLNKCIMLISILKNKNDYFIPKKRTFYKKTFLTHSSFIRPPNKKDSGFNVKNKITADGLWMKNNIRKFTIKKIYNISTTFYLGGISNLPSIRSLKKKSNTGIFSIFKEIIKFLLLKIVGKNYFFKIIYFFKYDRLGLNELKKLNLY